MAARWVGLAALISAAACTEANPLYMLKVDAKVDAGNMDVAGEAAPDAPTGCQKDDDCSGDPGGPACDTSTHKCVACTADKHCPADAGAPVCDTTAHTCVGCLPTPATENPCSGTAPICDGKTNACRGCTSDAECPAEPGICFPDGHCGAQGEVLYVKAGSSSCPGNGSLATPFCSPVDAVAAIPTDTAMRRTLLLRGTDLLPAFSIAIGGGAVNVFGQQGATVKGGPGQAAALDVTNQAVVFVRGVRFGSSDAGAGIYAHGNSVLHLDRCVVDSNTKGGIQIDGANFDITNTVIANNGATTFGGVTPYGGVYIGTIPAGGPSRFVNDTVVQNGQVGLACATAPQSAAGLILWMNSGQIDATPSCNVTPCCSGDPMFSTTNPYHLTSTSPCIDKLDTTLVTDDIDGDTRPQGPKSDCGADEYVPPSP